MKYKKSDQKPMSSKSHKKSKHKEKKSKSKDKKRHKKEKKYSSSSNSSDSDNEQEVWVEKTTEQSTTASLEEGLANTSKESESLKRDDWMNSDSIFPCIFNLSNEKKKVSSNKNKDVSILDKPGQSSKELNPYWKNGGSGLPQTERSTLSMEQTMDVKWLKKSLQRAKEQAESEGRSLHEIAAERWGSIEVIQSMIAKAENASTRDRSKNYKFKGYFKSDKRYKDDVHYSHKNRESRSNRSRSRFRSRSRSRSREYIDRYRKSDSPLFERKQRPSYKKPSADDNSDYSVQKTHSYKKRWRKDNINDKRANNESEQRVNESKISNLQIDAENDTKVEETKPLTEADMNKLGAKIVKAEIMGDDELAAELKAQLEKARQHCVKGAPSQATREVESVILTRTDAKGVTRPLEPRNQSRETSGSSKKRNNVPTHVLGERVRHFYDDDKYSLDQLFQREKGRSTSQDDASFVKAFSKKTDMDDIFEEQITRSRSDAKEDEKDRALAIKEHKRLSKSLDNCPWCIDSKYMLKHMIVTMDSDICLSLPQRTSLTDGHCILTPVQHTACQLQLDENVWDKLNELKKTLRKMFMDQDQYPVFFEIYKQRHKFPHMQLECVPLPKEVGESAPMYFKKALLECETEWSVNKKVIDLKQKNLRQSVPNGLSYFMVEFESDLGFAHVIEDEQMFPTNFAEEIIGGMLDLDPDQWRRPRKESFDQQREKVLKFTETWKNYDCKTSTDVN